MPSESARVSLYTRLEEVLGHENANTLMMSLPTQGSENLATKSDISHIEDRFDRLEDRFDRLEDRFDRLENRFDRQGARFDHHLRTYMIATVGAMTGLTAIFSIVISIFR